jgi:hypothetical protein
MPGEIKSKKLKLAKTATRLCGTNEDIQGLVWKIKNPREYQYLKRGNIFCFLSSFPLLPQATTAVFGSYLSSL